MDRRPGGRGKALRILWADRPTSGHVIDVDAVDDDRVVFRTAEDGGTGQPPLGAITEKVERALTEIALVGSVTDLVVPAEDHDGRPVEAIVQVFNLDTHAGVRPHPLHFLPDHRKTEQANLSRVIDDGNRHHVRLVHVATGQAAHAGFGQDFSAIGGCELVNDHGSSEYSNPALLGLTPALCAAARSMPPEIRRLSLRPSADRTDTAVRREACSLPLSWQRLWSVRETPRGLP